MFRHKEGVEEKEEKKSLPPDKEEKAEEVEEPKPVKTVHHSVAKNEGDFDIKELLEKNLKWSQIIYEQNRKINRKLVWAAVASWFRLFLILIPLLLALWFLPPYIRQVMDSYGSLFNNFVPQQNSTNSTSAPSPESVESLLRVLPISETQKEQIRAMMK